jgi:hypothetical protein
MIDWILSARRILEVPDRLTDVTSWHPHLPFAFWCVEALRPRVLVELGTHRGDSYSAFCQAVASTGCTTACYAVDTWRGDRQAGLYGEDVYEEFRAYHDARFAGFSRMVRSTFDEACARFSGGPIDLLHIDGLHTYEAVRHDFETWAPHLSRSAVVLFHAVDVLEGESGVWKFWEEARRQYPSFTFHHGHGLGVLLVGPDAPGPARRLAASTPEEAVATCKLFERLGEAVAGKQRQRLMPELTQESGGLVQELAQEREHLVQDLGHQRERLTAEEAETRRAVELLEAERAVARQLRELIHLARRRRGLARLWDSVQRRRTVRRLAASGLFDADYYRRTTPDLGHDADPVRHYVKTGVWQGQNPHPMFDTMFYLRENPDVARRGVNPLLHFARRGAAQGRRPHPNHSASEYLASAHRGQGDAAPPAAEPARLREQAGDRVKFRLQSLAAGPPPAAPIGERVATTIVASHVLPFPPRAGNEYRIHRVVRWLASIGHEVHLVVCPLPGEEPGPAALEQAAGQYRSLVVCGRDGTLVHRTDNARLRSALEELAGERNRNFPALASGPAGRLAPVEQTFCPDHLLDLLLRLAEAVEPDVFLANYIFMSRVLPRLPGGTFRIIDTHDVFSTKAHKVVQYGIRDDLALSPGEEGAMLRRADLVVAIQPEEERELREIVPDRTVVTAGVDFEVTADRSLPPREPIVLFVGSNNGLNVRGIRDFLSLAWPLIRRDRPDAKLRIVGPVCDSVDGGVDGIELLGRVDRLEDAYSAARVVVNPAVAGTGLKIKTVEALCNLRSIVLWPSGIDGLPPELASLCHVAGDWYDFARKVLHLLEAEEAGKLAACRDRLALELAPDRVYGAFRAALEERLLHADRSAAGAR